MSFLRHALPLALLSVTLAACTPTRDLAAETPPAVSPALPGDTTMPNEGEPLIVPGRGGMDGECHAERAQAAVGKTATAAVVEEARRSAGATIVRKLVPGQMVTMEYRADRLSVDVDANDVVTGVRCG